MSTASCNHHPVFDLKSKPDISLRFSSPDVGSDFSARITCALTSSNARLWTVLRCRKEPSFPSLARNQREVAACRSPFPFRLFEREEINAPTSVAGDQLDERQGLCQPRQGT